MIDIQDAHLATVKKIMHTYVPNMPIWVFGSRINGSAKPYSDLDLVIVGPIETELKTIYQIQDAFEESDLPYRVDVLDWQRISPEFRAVIKDKYELLPG